MCAITQRIRELDNDLLREMHPRYQCHLIPSRAIVVIMSLKECRERAIRDFWFGVFDLLYFWKKDME